MSDLVKRLRSIPPSVYEQVGDDLTQHDHLCVDTAIEAADRIEELEARITKDTTELQRLKDVLGDFDPRTFIDDVVDKPPPNYRQDQDDLIIG